MKTLLLTIGIMCTSLYATADAWLAGPSGNSGGAIFEDYIVNFDRFDRINICHDGLYIQSIEVTSVDINNNKTTFPTRGITGGTCQTFKFQPGEYLTKVEGTWHPGGTRIITNIKLTSNIKSVSFGTINGKPFIYDTHVGMQIIGFHGRSWDLLDAIGVVYDYR